MSRPAAVPVLDRDICSHSHSHSPQTTCTACVQACPHDVFSLSRQGIDLDAQACTGCGICVGLCPARALAQEISPPPREGTSLILVCPRHPAAGEAPQLRLRCLHAYGLNALAGWVLDGIRVIACASGDCTRCPDMPEDVSLPDSAARLAALAEAHGLPAPLLAAASPTQLRHWVQQA
ncbi:MAG: 4Fe-4S dicluster domain-containing protein [Paracoccus sp. (in: a-proteobacteria)]